MAQSYLKESSRLGVNLHAKPVVVSDPENSIKSIVNSFIGHYHIDFMIILDDHAVINNRNITTAWVPLLPPLDIQIAVPSDYFYELEPRIGSFALQPHFTEIGRVVASVINGAEANKWVINQKTIYTDKSIFYFRNTDGFISKRNQLQNDIVASFHPKTGNASNIQLAANVKVASDSQQNFMQSDLSLLDSAKTLENSSPPSSFVSPVKKTIMKESPLRSAGIDSSSVVDRIKTVHVAGAVIKDKQVNSESGSQSEKSNIRKQSPEPIVLSEAAPIKEQPQCSTVSSTVSSNDKENIEITATTTNIYRELTPDLPVLGIGRSGDNLKIFSEDSLWYHVDFFGIPGFLSKADARITTQQKYVAQPSAFNLLALIIGIVALIAVSLLVYVLLRIKTIRHNKSNRINCLLVAQRTKRIKFSNVNDSYISFTEYLENYGFHIRMTKNIKQINNLLLLNLPDIICVDWQFSIDIEDEIYEIMKNRRFTANFILIFYNVVDPSDMAKNGFSGDRTFFLSENFTISDLNIVLSMVKTDPDTSQQLPGQSTPFLEGKISDDTITEILQLMDINKKTGCLLVENHHPVGMIFFESGIITYAITNSQVAEQAVFEILSMKHGGFRFLPGKKPITKQVQLDIVAVLMERAKLVDEDSDSFVSGVSDFRLT